MQRENPNAFTTSDGDPVGRSLATIHQFFCLSVGREAVRLEKSSIGSSASKPDTDAARGTGGTGCLASLVFIESIGGRCTSGVMGLPPAYA